MVNSVGATVAALAVDVADSAMTSPPVHGGDDVLTALRSAAESTELPWTRLHVTSNRHRLVLVADGGVPCHDIAGVLLRALNATLLAAPGAPVRCRVALDSGLATGDATGWSGPAFAAVGELIGIPQLRTALAHARRSRVAVAASDRIVQSLVASGRTFDRSTWRSITIDRNGESRMAWLQVIGYPSPPGPFEESVRSTPVDPAGPATGRSVGINVEGDFRVAGDFVQGHKYEINHW